MTRATLADTEAGLFETHLSGLPVVAFDPTKALAVIEALATGKTVLEVCGAPGYPPRATFYRWIARYPDLKRAYDAARELSAEAFEEEALEMAQTLKRQNDFTGTKVRAFEVAMNQLRWSATRRDPRRYGEKQEMRMMIPIQINTSLDLTDSKDAPKGLGDTSYEIRAKVITMAETRAEDSTGNPFTDIDGVPSDPFDLPDKPAAPAFPRKLPAPARSFSPAAKTRRVKTPAGIRATIAAHERKAAGVGPASNKGE